MAPKWATVASHAAYGGVVIYCVGAHFDKLQIWSIPYTILLTRSVLGIADTALEGDNENVKKVYDFVDKLTQLFVFPCFVGSIWIKSSIDYHNEIGMLHPLLSLIPFGMYVMDKNDDNFVSSLLTANLASGIGIGILEKNWWCVAASVVFGVSHGLVRIKDDESHDVAEDTANFILAGYTYLTVLAA